MLLQLRIANISSFLFLESDNGCASSITHNIRKQPGKVDHRLERQMEQVLVRVRKKASPYKSREDWRNNEFVEACYECKAYIGQHSEHEAGTRLDHGERQKNTREI